jgi:hypothetical protein
LREQGGKICSLPILQANPRNGGAPFFPFLLLQEDLGNNKELAWHIFYTNTRMDAEPIHKILVVNDVLQSFAEP